MIEVERIDAEETVRNQEMRMAAYKKKLQEEAEQEFPSIFEQLEEIAGEFCDGYCKYPDAWDEEKEGCELSESDICKNCPIGKLV